MLSSTGARPHAWLLAALLPAGVLVVDPRGYAPFGPLRWAVVSVVALLAVAAAGRGVQHVARWPVVAWTVFVAWVAACAAFGVDPVYTWIGTAERHFGALTWALCGLLFVAGHALDDDADGRLVTGAAVVATGAAGVWAVAQELGWQPVPLAGSSRLTGSLGSPAYLGAAMALALPMAVGVALDRSWSQAARRGAALAAALSAAALLGSGARAAWVGVAVAAMVIVLARREVLVQTVRARPRAAASVVAAGIVVVVFVGVLSGAGGRVTGLFARDSAGGTSRVDEWRMGVDVLRAHPLTGVGPEGYRVTFPTVVTAAYEQSYGSAVVPDRAHDILLDVAVTTGLPGLAAYLAVLALCGVLVLPAVRYGDPWVCGVAAGLVAYTAQELFLFPIGELEPAVWLLVGLVAVRASRAHEQAPLRVPRAMVAVAVGLAVVAAIAGGRDVAADHDTRAALADLGTGQLGRAQAAANRAVALRPDQIDYRLGAARADAPGGLAGIAEALAQMRLALDVSPGDPVLHQENAALLVQRAEASSSATNTGAALTYLTGITRVDHADAESELELGVVLALRGEQSEAEGPWLAAARLAPTDAGPPTDLATVYASEGRWGEASREARTALRATPPMGEPRTCSRKLRRIMEPDGGGVGVPGVDQLTAPAPEDLTSGPEDPLPDGPAVVGFADFYRQSRTGLVRAVAVTIGDRDLAVEAVDEAFARAYPRWSRVGRLESPGGWVFRVALNWATSVLRRRRRAPQSLGERDPSDIGPIGEPDVLVALAELDVRQRAVVVCRLLLGRSQAETADALDIPAGTVKSRLHRATQHLATRLDHLRPDHLRGPETEDHR